MMTSQPFGRTWWHTAILAVLLSLGCTGSPTSSTPPSTPSNPALATALRVSMTGAPIEQVAYVALDQGTIDAGMTATITNRVSGVERAAPVVNGGFDPVGIPANTGDTLVVSVATAAGQVMVAAVVARPHPPHVVRVNPPKDQTDVPVNMNLTVVFNEPVSAGTITTATIQLHQGTTSVPGTISVNPATPWLVTFAPSQPLVPATTYTVNVTGAIADPSGLTLDAPMTTSFATEAAVGSVVITPQVSEFGGHVQLTATARDAAGHPLADRTFVWTSSDTSLASVDATGFVTGSVQRSGTVTITATTAGHSGSETMKVDCSSPTPACTTSTFGLGTRTVTGTFSRLMPDGTVQPAPNTPYFAWINIPNRGGYTSGLRQSDANGAFRIDSLPDGAVGVMASPVGLVQPCMAAANTMGQNATLNITVVDPANPLPQLTTTAPAVAGSVYRMINGVKTPLAGAILQFNIWVPDLVLAETVTDSNGRYALCNLQFSFPDVELGYVSAVAPEFQHVSDKWVTITVSGPGTLDIIVP